MFINIKKTYLRSLYLNKYFKILEIKVKSIYKKIIILAFTTKIIIINNKSKEMYIM